MVLLTNYVDNAFKQRILPFLNRLDKNEIEKYFSDLEQSIHQLVLVGKDPIDILNLIVDMAKYLSENSGESFSADYQVIPLSNNNELWTFQLPGGGNIYLFRTDIGDLIIDSGYGYYYNDTKLMLTNLGLGGYSKVKKIICTHADADHCGATGYFNVPTYMHPLSKQILDNGIRCFGVKTRNEVLERSYTTTINTLSQLCISKSIELFNTQSTKKHGLFPIIDKFEFGNLSFEVWESLGGHVAGQVFLYEKNEGLLFTSDALINFNSLTQTRKEYCSIADEHVCSVNVNSEVSRTERYELMRIAKEIDESLNKIGKRLLICCGHGAISILDSNTGNLIQASDVIKYTVK